MSFPHEYPPAGTASLAGPAIGPGHPPVHPRPHPPRRRKRNLAAVSLWTGIAGLALPVATYVVLVVGGYLLGRSLGGETLGMEGLVIFAAAFLAFMAAQLGGVVLCLIAVITGRIALGRIRSGYAPPGSSAVVGLVLGYVGIAIMSVYLVWNLMAFY